MKISIKIFAFFFSFVAYFLHAQTTFNANQILPCNTDIKIGKLDNELTYYIRANKYTETNCFLFICQSRFRIENRGANRIDTFYQTHGFQ